VNDPVATDSEGDNTPPLLLDISARANEQIADLAAWFYGQSHESGERFRESIKVEIPTLCQRVADEIATGGRPAFLPDEAASLAYSRPTYSRIFTTQKKRTRRSASVTFRIIYVLLDADKDGKVDTLSILSVRHGAARPIWDVDTDEE
jgi:hypothetical protein